MIIQAHGGHTVANTVQMQSEVEHTAKEAPLLQFTHCLLCLIDGLGMQVHLLAVLGPTKKQFLVNSRSCIRALMV